MAPFVREVAEHVLHAGGKRLRPLLTVLTARMLGYTHADIYPLAASMEMLHAATLLHDDVIDNASDRRGKAASHHVFGIAKTILCGDAMLACASQAIAAYDNLQMGKCIALAMQQTATGQIMELDRQVSRNTDPDLYLEIIRGKTAWLLRACCELAALRAGVCPETVALAAEFGMQIGMAFQLVDDALDFASPSQTGKPAGGDIREGKLTPPLALHLDTLAEPERRSLVHLLVRRKLGEAEVARLMAVVRERGFDRATRAMADPYLDKARAALAGMREAFPERQEAAMLDEMILYVRDRDC
jgi:octaprenyl-diphosphate synthase